MKRRQFLPLLALALILGPATVKLLHREEAPAPVVVEHAPAPPPAPAPSTPREWYAFIQSRCTPADVRLATDLHPPPEGTEGTGYKAACLAVARQIPSARALLLSLPEDERLQGASVVYDVAQQLAQEEQHGVAGPLMELVLEFWPDHYLALYEAGRARYVTGDMEGATEFLAHFLDVYVGEDDLTANARQMMARHAER